MTTREISPRQASSLLRTLEAGRFRQTINDQGLLQQGRGAGGIKGKLVAWVLASPGREGSFAGRSVKALVNLFDKGGFETISSALQSSRQQSIDNLFRGVLRYGEDQLDADFNRQFSEAARALVQVKGKRFSAINFGDMDYTIRELAGKQKEARKSALDAVSSGQPTPAMQALTAEERGQVIKALSSGVDMLRQSNLARTEQQLTLDALAAACDTRESRNVGDVLRELSGLYRHLQAELGEHRKSAPDEEYTGTNESVRQYLLAQEQEGKAMDRQLHELRDNYSKALQTLEPAAAPAQSGTASTPQDIPMEAVVRQTVSALDRRSQSAPAGHAPDAPNSEHLAMAIKDVKQELGQAMTDYETLKKINVSDTTLRNHERYVQTLGGTLLELEQALTDPRQAQANLFADKVRSEALDTILPNAVTAEDVLTAHDDVEKEHSRALADFDLMKQAKVGDTSKKNHLYYMQDLVSTVFELKNRLEKVNSPASAPEARRASAPQAQARDVQTARDAARNPERPGTVPAQRRVELERMLSDAIQDHKRATAEYESMRKGKFSPAALQSQLFLMNEAVIRISSLGDQIDKAGKA